MYKQIIVTLSLIAASCVLGVSATEPDACSTRALEYLKLYSVEPSVQVLVDELRRFYPNLSEEIVNKPMSKEFANRMAELGPQSGCQALKEHIEQLGDETHVPCFSERRDNKGIFGLVSLDQSIKPMVEGFYACMVSELQTSD